MPNRPSLNLLLFDGPTSSTVLEDLTPAASDVRFSTALHGGFASCTVAMAMDRARAWTTWLTDRFGFRLGIYEGARLIWEGRKEDVTLGEAGVEVRFAGFWANLGDFPHLDYSFDPPRRVTYQSAVRADDVFKDVLTKLPASQIDGDLSHIGRPTVAVAGAQEPLTFDRNETGQEAVMAAASWSGSGSPWYAAIWDGRKAHLAARDVGSVTWRASVDDLAPGWRFHLSFSDYASDVYADYLAAGASTLTSLAADEEARRTYGRRASAVRLGRDVPAGAASRVRDARLATSARPRQFGGFTLRGFVSDAERAETPLWRVRAGDVIRFDDLVPAAVDLDRVTLDGLRTFFAVETEYRQRDNTLRVRPDAPSRTLPRILQRAGIGG